MCDCKFRLFGLLCTTWRSRNVQCIKWSNFLVEYKLEHLNVVCTRNRVCSSEKSGISSSIIMMEYLNYSVSMILGCHREEYIVSLRKASTGRSNESLPIKKTWRGVSSFYDGEDDSNLKRRAHHSIFAKYFRYPPFGLFIYEDSKENETSMKTLQRVSDCLRVSEWCKVELVGI